MKILATGDLHLGAGADLGREPGDRLRDQAAVLDQIAHLARTEEVAAVLVAGDVFDRPRPLPEELAVAADFVDLLDDVLIITGNAGHDIRNAEAYAAVQLFDYRNWVDVHRQPGVWRRSRFAVATLPSVPVSRLVASRNGGPREAIYADAADYLLEVARGLRAEIPADTPAVLLAHWSVSGASLPNGLPTDALNETVLPLPDLEALGFDAIVLGHIHKAQLLNEPTMDELRPMLYVGSPMPLNFGEAETAHGVFILEWDAVGFFRERFFPIESRRFVTVDADLTSRVFPSDHAHDETDEIAAAIAEQFPLEGAIVRIRYKASAEQHRRVDQAALRRLILDAGAAKVHGILPDVVREDRARVAGLDEQVDGEQALDAWLAAQDVDRALASRMRVRHARYLEEARA